MRAITDWCVRCLPLAFGVAFIGGLLGYRALRFYRRYGRSPIHVPRRGDSSAHAFLSRVLGTFLVAVLALGVLAALWPEALEALDLLYAQRGPALLVPGAFLGAVAAWLVWRGQEDMAASWRIGITPEQTDLVTGGLFRFCRNPIYLGLQVALVAFCFLLPGYFSCGLLVLGAVLLHVQARLEEQHLLERHGRAYAAYRARVGRFLPFTGRGPAPVTATEQQHGQDR
jgi:protein-S-isoprenylcysteine O-methyltransferase Ste14